MFDSGMVDVSVTVLVRGAPVVAISLLKVFELPLALLKELVAVGLTTEEAEDTEVIFRPEEDSVDVRVSVLVDVLVPDDVVGEAPVVKLVQIPVHEEP